MNYDEARRSDQIERDIAARERTNEIMSRTLAQKKRKLPGPKARAREWTLHYAGVIASGLAAGNTYALGDERFVFDLAASLVAEAQKRGLI